MGVEQEGPAPQREGDRGGILVLGVVDEVGGFGGGAEGPEPGRAEA